MTGKMNPRDPIAAPKMDDSDPGATSNNNHQEGAAKSTTTITTNKNPKDDSLDQHQKTVNMSLKLLWENHLPENRKALEESQINLDKIANYCEANYFQDDFKDEAFNLTKNYCHQALASVTSQIYSYASNIQAALNLLDTQFDLLDAQTQYIGRKLTLHREKQHRKAIGLLTIPKHNTVQPKVIFPSLAKVKTNVRYTREPLDLSVLDQIGVGQKIKEAGDRKLKATTGPEMLPKMYKSATLRPSKSSNLSSIVIGQHQQHPNDNAHNSHNINPNSNDSSTLLYGQRSMLVNSYGTLANSNSNAASASAAGGLPPHPNPSTNTMFGSLARNPKDPYRQSKPVMMIPPPQVPSNYMSMKELNESNNANQSAPTTTTTTPPTASSTGTITQSASGLSGSSLLLLSANPVSSSRKSSTVSSTNTNQDQDSGQMLLPPPPSPLPSTLTSGGGGEEEQSTNDHQPPVDQPEVDWIPASYLEKVIAIYDYNADKDDELSFQENSVIYVIRKNEDGWWEGIMNGVTGLFPGNYVEHCM